MAKPDEEVLSHLVDIKIRQKFLSRMSDYQAEVRAFAQREPASASSPKILLLLNQLDGKMKAACNEENYPGLLKEIRSAELIYSFFEKEKAIHQEVLGSISSMPESDPAALNQEQAPSPFLMAMKNAKQQLLEAEVNTLERKLNEEEGEQVESFPSPSSRAKLEFSPSFIQLARYFHPKNVEGLSEKINDETDGVILVRQHDYMQTVLKKFLSSRMKEDPTKNSLLTLMQNQYVQLTEAANAHDQTILLKEIHQAQVLYPYCEKKLELLRRLMRIPGCFFNPELIPDRVDLFWDSMHPNWRAVMDSLDHLAVSGFMFEKEIAERNDTYLTHELDKVRDVQEKKFVTLLEDAKATLPLPEVTLIQHGPPNQEFLDLPNQFGSLLCSYACLLSVLYYVGGWHLIYQYFTNS